MLPSPASGRGVGGEGGNNWETACDARQAKTEARHDDCQCAQTPPEQILWSILRGRRLAGLKFRRQEPIGPYIVDFCCRQLKLIVELDGMSHFETGDRDEVRTRWLEEQGYRVFRVTNWDVNEDLEAVARGIAREAGVSID
jgi:very-short-patch-repair endonuclease